MRSVYAPLWLAVFAAFGCGSSGIPKVPPTLSVSPNCPVVKVLLGEADKVEITGEVEFVAVCGGKRQKFRGGQKVVASAKEGNVVLGSLTGERVVVEGAFDGTLKVFGLHWRGKLVLVAAGVKVRVINEVAVESYLVGVVGREMGAGFSPEALAAQAIAARTYALWMMRRRRNRQFHLTRRPNTQAYGGVEAESPSVRQAVRATSGLVLTYKGKIFPAFYHAICGGMTSSAAFVFGSPVYGTTPDGDGPLDGGVICTFCDETAPPHRLHWTLLLTQNDAVNLLEKAGHRVGQVNDIIPTDSDSAQRHRTVIFRTDKGDIKMSTATLRRLLSYRLHSSLFSVRKKGKDFVITGRGWGHGVGLCQWGAEGMARLTYSCAQILQTYYPNSKLKRLW